MVSGKELVFRKPGEESDGEGDEEDGDHNEEETGPQPALVDNEQELTTIPYVPTAKAPAITIHEDD